MADKKESVTSIPFSEFVDRVRVLEADALEFGLAVEQARNSYIAALEKQLHATEKLSKHLNMLNQSVIRDKDDKLKRLCAALVSRGADPEEILNTPDAAIAVQPSRSPGVKSAAGRKEAAARVG